MSRNPTPKERFLLNKIALKAHEELFSDPMARESMDTALLQYQRELLREPPSPVTFERIRGAQEFIAILMNLSLAPEQSVHIDRGNLKH